MIHTNVCDVLGIEHPIVQTGMGVKFTNPELVAAVSNSGALGVLGCTSRTAHEACEDIDQIRALTDRPFGVNFFLPRLNEATFCACLDKQVPIFSYFHGDPEEVVKRAHAVGAQTIHQVTTVEEAQRASAVGVDVLVAQGCEGGGHVGFLPLMNLLPEVVVVAGTRPVLAAGGIVDGQGLAAALCFGASGILMGTRFLATIECPARSVYKQAILSVHLGDTIVTGEDGVGGILRGAESTGLQVRLIRNKMTEWIGHEDELRAVLEQEREKYRHADQVNDPSMMLLTAGQGAGRIREIKPAGQVVEDIIAEAELILKKLPRYVRGEEQ